jgi:hypothetical protein
MLPGNEGKNHDRMKRKPINPKEASVAATFYEPAYQRLRQWHNGREIDMLCFVRETSAPVRKILDELGARKSDAFRAKCFAEVWELPHAELVARAGKGETAELDRRISDAMGCLGGDCSAKVGFLSWGDFKEGTIRRHFPSRLLQETAVKKGRAV